MMTNHHEWVAVWGKDPPPAPKGFKTEVERDSFLGYVVAYRYVKE